MGDATSRLPDAGAGFVWDDERVPLLRPLTGRAVAAYTTRMGGVSDGPFDSLNVSLSVGDERERVLANRTIAGGCVGADERWRGIRQVHGADVVEASAGHPDADGQWADRTDAPLAAVSADCILLLLAGTERIGVAHAGWRGLLAGVVENAVAVTGAGEVFAGPAVGPCCFEVGPEVTEPFAARYPESVAGRHRIDLWVATEIAARRAGAVRVDACRICTACHPELFFSFRRDRGRTGRQALLARTP